MVPLNTPPPALRLGQLFPRPAGWVGFPSPSLSGTRRHTSVNIPLCDAVGWLQYEADVRQPSVGAWNGLLFSDPPAESSIARLQQAQDDWASSSASPL